MPSRAGPGTEITRLPRTGFRTPRRRTERILRFSKTEDASPGPRRFSRASGSQRMPRNATERRSGGGVARRDRDFVGYGTDVQGSAARNDRVHHGASRSHAESASDDDQARRVSHPVGSDSVLMSYSSAVTLALDLVSLDGSIVSFPRSTGGRASVRDAESVPRGGRRDTDRRHCRRFRRRISRGWARRCEWVSWKSHR